MLFGNEVDLAVPLPMPDFREVQKTVNYRNRYCEASLSKSTCSCIQKTSMANMINALDGMVDREVSVCLRPTSAKNNLIGPDTPNQHR